LESEYNVKTVFQTLTTTPRGAWWGIRRVARSVRRAARRGLGRQTARAFESEWSTISLAVEPGLAFEPFGASDLAREVRREERHRPAAGTVMPPKARQTS